MKSKNILVVDDDYLDIVSVQRTFNKLKVSAELTVAHNGKEALNMLRGEETDKIEMPDIILLDINMPKMNGIEFLEKLRNDTALRHITVFILTTSGEEFDKRQAESLGISGYIVKPLDLDNYEDRNSSIDNFNLLLEILR